MTILIKDNNSIYLDLIVQEKIFNEIPEDLLISNGNMAKAKYMCANQQEKEYFKNLDSSLSFDEYICDYLRIYTQQDIENRSVVPEGM